MVTRPTETNGTQNPCTGDDNSWQIVTTNTESPKSTETLSVQDTNPQSIHKETQSVQTMDPQSIYIHYPESMDPSSPPGIHKETQSAQTMDPQSIHIHYPPTPDTQPRPIINVHYAQNPTTHTHCRTCGSQMQDIDDDGGNSSTDGVNGSAYGDSPTARDGHHPLTGCKVIILVVIILLILPFIMTLVLSYIEFVLIPVNGQVESLLHSESTLRELLQDL